MVRKFSKFPKKPADWVPPSAPLSMRKQVYLPDFTIALIRTPFLPPRYASFYVPLNFNKLDMRDYMQRVYGVKVLSVRSYVEQQKVTRQRPLGRLGLGPLRRPKSKKKMTIEMAEPFVWPEEPKDFSPWEKNQFYEATEYQEKQGKPQTESAKEPNEAEREAYAEQAKLMLEGKLKWRPTWQALGLNYDRPLLPPSGKQSTGSS
ncbi:putative mitochondrial ribosomal protein L23 [Thermoascus aurantiacus ATCC 26904]